MPSDLTGIKIVRKEYPLLKELVDVKSWACIFDGQRRAQLSVLPWVVGVECFGVITGHDYLETHLFKIDMADSLLCPLCSSVPMTGEHLFGCLSLLHVHSQDNCGVLSPTCATSVLYWTARHFVSKRLLMSVIKKNVELVSPPLCLLCTITHWSSKLKEDEKKYH
ncbi:hypothetical protein TNCV_3881681 [Trichonephila clavipes]|nr:hypothetical protein TNCV_3881681 [Trichonephila clavipes]